MVMDIPLQLPNMEYGSWNIPYRSVVRMLLLPSTLLLFTRDLPINVIAQTLPTTSTTRLASGASSSVATSLASISHAQSMTTSFRPLIASNATSAPITSASTAITNDILPGGSQPTQASGEGIFHYYWLILALFGAFFAIFLWWTNRRRRRRKEQLRRSGHDALARDMEGWVNAWRWFNGTWRPYQTRTLSRREEGLNEHGEAPPPYQPKDDVAVTEGTLHNSVVNLPIPLRALSRDEVDVGRPPEYRETIRRGQTSRIESSPTDSRTVGLNASHSLDSPSRSSGSNPPPD